MELSAGLASMPITGLYFRCCSDELVSHHPFPKFKVSNRGVFLFLYLIYFLKGGGEVLDYRPLDYSFKSNIAFKI